MHDAIDQGSTCAKCGTAAHLSVRILTTRTYERANPGNRRALEGASFRHGRSDSIYLPTAYAKADREDLSPADMKALSRLVAAIKKEERNR